MNKRSKKLLLMALTLALLGGATVLATKLNPELNSSETTEEESSVTSSTILELDESSVSNIKWTYNEETLSFSQNNGSWTYDGDSAFPLNTGYLDTIFTNLSSLTAYYEPLENVEDLAEYGLDDPAMTVTITTADGETELNFGSASLMDSLRYFSMGDGKIYMVSNSLISDYQYALYDLIQMEAIPSISDYVSFDLSSANGDLHFDYLEDSGLAYSDEYVWFYNNEALDTQLMTSHIQNVTTLSWTECINYNASAEDLASYGLDTPQLTATVTYKVDDAEKTFTLEMGDYAGDYCYARISGSSMVYTIDATICDTLLHTDVSALRPDEVLLMDWDDVNSIYVAYDEESFTAYRLVNTTTSEDGTVTSTAEYAVDGVTVELQDILDSITSMSSSGYADSLTAGKELLNMAIITNGSVVELSFSQYDSESCIVSLNGSSTVLCSRSDVDTVIENLKNLF